MAASNSDVPDYVEAVSGAVGCVCASLGVDERESEIRPFAGHLSPMS